MELMIARARSRKIPVSPYKMDDKLQMGDSAAQTKGGSEFEWPTQLGIKAVKKKKIEDRKTRLEIG